MNSLLNSNTTNYAPITPLLELGRNAPQPASFLWDALRERFQHYLQLEKNIWDDMQRAGETVSNFLVGKHFVTPNPFAHGQFIPYTPPNTNHTKRAMNLVQFYVSNCLFKWQLSNPDIQVNPAIDTDEAEEAADAATIIVDHYEREFFSVRPETVIAEGLQGMCWGSYTWRLFPDTRKLLAHAVRDVLENRDVTLSGYGQCTDLSCGYMAEDSAFPESRCPECGGEAYIDTPTVSLPQVVGQEQVPIFDLSAELVPFTNVRWDLRSNLHDSPWLIVRKRTNFGVIKALFGNVRIPEGQGDRDRGLDIADRLAYIGQPQAGFGVGERTPTLYKQPVTIEEHWMAPEDYADIELKSDTETISGITIPAGRLVDHFPDGLLIQGLNEMAVIVGIYAEQHKDYMTQGVWYSRPMSGAGRGLQDLVEVNKRFNADDSQVHNYLRSVSTPAMLVVNGAISEGKQIYSNTPGENIPVDLMNLPEGMKPRDVITPAFTPPSVPAQMFDYTYNRLNNLAQIVSHVTDFSAGLPGVNNRTATGARITQANSNLLFTAPLQIKSGTRVQIAKQTVALYRKHIPIERYFPLKGKYGRAQGKYLAGANLCDDLVFDVVPDSELPKNSEIKREDYTSFFMAFGNAQIYKDMKDADPEMVKDVEQAFGIRTRAESYSVVASLCLSRVKQMLQFAAMTDDPQSLLLAIQPPVNPMEDQVEEKIQWYRNYLDTDPGLEAPLHVRAAIGLVIQFHFQMLAQIQMAVQGVANQAEAAGQPEQPDPNAAKQAEGERSRQHQSSENALQRSHEKEVAKVKASEKGKKAA